VAERDRAGRAIAYVSEKADSAFWTRRWLREDVHRLLDDAATSPVTAFIARHVRPGDRMLEAGCGLGQYVVHFARRGIDVVGVDFSEAAVERHRRAFPGSDVRVADLRRLPFDDSSFDVYVSLGVVEHYEHGAGPILDEARRVLHGGGRLLLSTPYVNLVRRLLRRRIEARQRARAGAGGAFYQYAFDARRVDAMLDAAGFDLTERAYYDLRRGWRELVGLVRPNERPRRSASRRVGGRRSRGRRLVASAPPLALALAHMQIVSATKRTRNGRG
jgi:SAM-dependent methyltransferase